MDDLRESITNLNEQMMALLAAIQPLLASAATPPSAAPVPAAAATVTPAVAFVLSPGTTNTDQLIDYSTCTGQSLYDTGKSKLMDD